MDEQLDDSLRQEITVSSQRYAAFEQQLADFEATADSNPSPIGRPLTFVIANTMDIAVKMGDMIRNSLPETPTIDDLERHQGKLNDYFKATRQVDRFANLELRMEEMRLRSADARQTNRSGGCRPGVQRGGSRHLRGPSPFRD